MTVGTLIAAAFPKNAAKHIETELQELGCTPRQAWRIVSTGKVPSRFRVALVRALDAVIDNRIISLQYHQAVLKADAYAEMVQRADDRRKPAGHSASKVAARQADGAGDGNLVLPLDGGSR